MISGRISTTKRQQKSIFFVKFFRQVRSFGDGRRQTKKFEKSMKKIARDARK